MESGFGSGVGCWPRCCRGVGVGGWTSLDESGEKKRGMSRNARKNILDLISRDLWDNVVDGVVGGGH